VVHPTWARTRPDLPEDQHHGWAFASPGEAFSNQNGFGSFAFNDVTMDPHDTSVRFVRDLYNGADVQKYTVPILWDTKHKVIVNNESAEIVRILNSEFNDYAINPDIDLNPSSLIEA
jgi:glutathionyl-hydroquinone reductase